MWQNISNSCEFRNNDKGKTLK
ncbi:hypothetical protein Bhyg_08163 [Pseudolycoriella hygida]|uniref:Uncharacterized protein n=1 Tax=Pseudolycoriella hygida TaxID=35572 RepID=A0A9Q0N5D0_9DIPT|nr:hypothetical protein Bhyg_08163 [Pseudolycoriella hygida]